MKFLALLFILAGCTQVTAPPSDTSTSTSTHTDGGTNGTGTMIGVIPKEQCPVGQYVKVIDHTGNLVCSGKPVTCPAATPAGCPEKDAYVAIDIAGPVSKKLLETLKCSGIETIIRYYDHPGNETIKGKIPLAGELALIKEYGFSVLFVFQHNNNKITTFENTDRPAQDVAAILSLAKKFGQPKGSGIYVGVDGDFYTTAQQASVKSYFSKVAPKLREAGFKVGMYGGGANCVNLQNAKLLDLPCWIAASSWGWSGTKAALAAGNHGLKQKVNQSCQGHSLDYNTSKYADFGQWWLP